MAKPTAAEGIAAANAVTHADHIQHRIASALERIATAQEAALAQNRKHSEALLERFAQLQDAMVVLFTDDESEGVTEETAGEPGVETEESDEPVHDETDGGADPSVGFRLPA